MLGRVSRIFGRLLEAAGYVVATVKYQPVYYSGCPYDGICDRCPAADEDDVCMPDERRAFELCERYAANRN